MLRLRLGLGGKRYGCKGVLKGWASGLPSSEEYGTSRQIARTNSLFPNLRLAFYLRRASRTCHSLYMKSILLLRWRYL